MRTNMFPAGPAITLGLLLAMSTPAAAESVIVTGNPGPSLTVSTADLNLRSPTGLARLQSRIEAAAADLCLTNAVEPIDTRLARAKCYRTAVSRGNREIDRLVAVQGASSTSATAAILAKTGG